MSIAAPAAAVSGPTGRRATIHTTKGDIHFDLFPDQAPKTVENFVGLAKKHYYDEIIFHRIIPKFVSSLGSWRGETWFGRRGWASWARVADT